MSLEKYNELRTKFQELDEEWQHSHSEKTPKGILTLFAKLIADDYDNTGNYAKLASRRPSIINDLLPYAKRWRILNDEEIFDFSIATAGLCTLKCYSIEKWQVAPLNEYLFVEYLSEQLDQNKILQMSLDISSDATSLKFGTQLDELKKNSNLFKSYEENLGNKLSSISEQTITELQSELENAKQTGEADKTALLQQLEDEKEMVGTLIEKYQSISKAALNNLASSFATFSDNKRTEMDKWQKYTKYIGMSAVAIALIAIIFHPATGIITAWNEAKAAEDVITAFFSSNLVYFLVIEALVIYFFRICLNNFYAARDELLQLEIREALCKFAPTYTAFADADDTRLDNFTKHIFSPLASKMNPTPHPLDFLGQVCNVVNNGKKK